MAIDKVLMLALATRPRGADRIISGSMKTDCARVFGSNIARRCPLAGSNTALPALTVAVVGVVGTMNCGSLGADNLGLRRLPSAWVTVHSSLTGLFSAARMLAARAVTMAEPPPTATTASASTRRSSSAASSTEDTGLWPSTSE